jgi:hypothetical protein
MANAKVAARGFDALDMVTDCLLYTLAGLVHERSQPALAPAFYKTYECYCFGVFWRFLDF